MTNILLNRRACFAALVLGATYLIGFGLLRPPYAYTISTIGLMHPWGFRLWGAVAAGVVAMNTLYMYRKFSYRNRAAMWAMAAAAASIVLTTNVPVTEELSLRTVLHWFSAIFYALLMSGATMAFMLHAARRRRSRRAFATLLTLLGLAVTMFTWLTITQNGLIELIPLVSLLVILGLANFTRVYDDCLPMVAVPRKAKQLA